MAEEERTEKRIRFLLHQGCRPEAIVQILERESFLASPARGRTEVVTGKNVGATSKTDAAAREMIVSHGRAIGREG